MWRAIQARLALRASGEFVRAGRARPLGVCSLAPSPAFPDVPAIAKDLPGFEVTAWFGLFAPRGIPKDLVMRIRDDVAAALHTPEVKQRFFDIGSETGGQMPEEFTARVRDEIARWQKVAAAAGVK